MSHLKINIVNDVLKLFGIYYSQNYEVGGILFGERSESELNILTISFKKGSSSEIEFNMNDSSIFVSPKNLDIIGTWHSHVCQSNPMASIIDHRQWKKWGSDYIHIVTSKKQFTIYNFDLLKGAYVSCGGSYNDFTFF